MSDEKLWEGEPPTRKRDIHVTVEGGKSEVEKYKKEAEELRKILDDLATKELEEKKQEIKGRVDSSEWEHIDGMSGFELDGYISGLDVETKRRKPSSGSVRLSRPDNTLRQELTAEEYVDFIYEHASNSKSPYYNQARKYKNHLRGLLKPKDFVEVKEMEYTSNPIEKTAIKELGRNFGYQEFTEFVQRLAREKNAR